MNATLSRTETDTLLKRMNDCIWSAKVNSLPLKNQMPKVSLPKT